MDSLSAIEVADKIGSVLGIVLPSTLLFDFPSVPSLTEHVADLMAAPSTVDAASRPHMAYGYSTVAKDTSITQVVTDAVENVLGMQIQGAYTRTSICAWQTTACTMCWQHEQSHTLHLARLFDAAFLQVAMSAWPRCWT